MSASINAALPSWIMVELFYFCMTILIKIEQEMRYDYEIENSQRCCFWHMMFACMFLRASIPTSLFTTIISTLTPFEAWLVLQMFSIRDAHTNNLTSLALLETFSHPTTFTASGVLLAAWISEGLSSSCFKLHRDAFDRQF